MDPFLLIAAAFYIAVGVFVLQLVDSVTTAIDARTVRDDEEPDALTRTRFRELFWTVAVTAALAVFIAFAVDAAGQLIWEAEQPGTGVLVLVSTALVAFVIGLVATVAVVRRERPSYARIRRDLRDRSTLNLDGDELAEFETRLDRADRIAARRPRAAGALRIIGLVVVVCCGGGTAVAFALGDAPLLALVIAVFLLAHVAAFVVAIRAAAVRQGKLDRVLEIQRGQVVALLERARIPQRGRVPGLRDRVSRALAILREKQR